MTQADESFVKGFNEMFRGGFAEEQTGTRDQGTGLSRQLGCL